MIIVMEAPQDREGDNSPSVHTWSFHRCGARRDRLANPLMGPGVVEVRGIRAEHAAQVRFAQDEQMAVLAPVAIRGVVLRHRMVRTPGDSRDVGRPGPGSTESDPPRATAAPGPPRRGRPAPCLGAAVPR